MLDSSSEEFPGACALLQNLIPAQNNRGMMVARPAATALATLPDYGGGPLTCLAAIGNMIYGMYASQTFTGKDRPFAYNLATGAFLSISGLAAANLPTSQPTTGDWTPPTADSVATRVLFTHPGFPGGVSNTPYWETGLANTYNGQTKLDGITDAFVPFLAVGMAVFGNGIPTGTTIAAVSSSLIYTTATGSSGGNTITVGSATGLVIGQAAIAPGIPAGTIINNIAGTTITLSQNLTANLTAVPIQFGANSITMSQAATATANQVQVYFASSTANKFGWLDLSGLSISTQANTVSGLPVLTGGPTIVGVQPGMTVSGPGIPAGTAIEQAAAVVFQNPCNTTANSGQITFGGPTVGNSGIAVGQSVAGANIPAGAQIVSITNSTTFQLNVAATATSSSPVELTFSGAIITLSQPATATATGVGVTIAGGSPSNPLWGAGDTNITPLAAVPVFVRQYAGSAAFGVNTTNPSTAGVTFSDAGIPCQVTNASQAVLFQGGIPVTAAAGLPLSNQLGGIIQSLVVFQGASNIQQVTGSIALSNLSINTSQVATGTFAPNSIASTPKGLIFAAPFGLRLVNFDGGISDPIGAKGMGTVIPFQNAVTPTRMAAAFNENVYRITMTWLPPPNMQIVWGASPRTDEFWLHLDTARFSGPHTCSMDLAAPWVANESFVGALTAGRGSLWRSDPDPEIASAYTENGVPLTWTLQTVPLPDNATMYANAINESSVFGSLSPQSQWLVSFIDDQGETLDQTYVWAGPGVPLARQAQIPIYWHDAIAFRQGSVQITGPSEAQTLIGAIELRYQQLKYPFTYRPTPQFVLGETVLGDGGAASP